MLLKSTYKKDDVIILLKDVSNVQNILNQKNNNLFTSYSDYIPEEKELDSEYIKIVEQSLMLNAKNMATYIAILTNEIYEKYENIVLVSLLRAGTSLGVLMKNYSESILKKKVNHYSIALSRDKGIDFNALNYIRKNNPNRIIVFIDGWVGKGTTRQALINSCQIYNKKYNERVSPILAVLCDLLGQSDFYATTKDILIPMSLLNAQACGLISRITQNEKVIKEKDYAGAIRFDYLKKQDKTYLIIDEIKKHFNRLETDLIKERVNISLNIKPIQEQFNIKNVNGVKAGINETIRILLKKDVSLVLIKESSNQNLSAIKYICDKKNVEIVEYKDLTCEAIALLFNHIGEE